MLTHGVHAQPERVLEEGAGFHQEMASIVAAAVHRGLISEHDGIMSVLEMKHSRVCCKGHPNAAAKRLEHLPCIEWPRLIAESYMDPTMASESCCSDQIDVPACPAHAY